MSDYLKFLIADGAENNVDILFCEQFSYKYTDLLKCDDLGVDFKFNLGVIYKFNLGVIYKILHFANILDILRIYKVEKLLFYIIYNLQVISIKKKEKKKKKIGYI